MAKVLELQLLASVLPVSIQSWFHLRLTSLISLQSRDSQESFPAPQFESINSSALSLVYGPTLTSVHDYWKKHSFGYMDFVSQVTFLLFNMLSRFVIAFLPRSKRLLISWPQYILFKKYLSPYLCKYRQMSDTSPSICVPLRAHWKRLWCWER